MCHVTTVRRRVVTKVTKVTKLWLLHLFAVKKYNRYISVAIFFSRLSSVSLFMVHFITFSRYSIPCDLLRNFVLK